MEEGQIQQKEKIDIQEPKNYTVIILNDDYTPMDFVEKLIAGVFHKTMEESAIITNNIHTKGKGICGVFPYEIAEIKVHLANVLAEENEFPLQTIMEPE